MGGTGGHRRSQVGSQESVPERPVPCDVLSLLRRAPRDPGSYYPKRRTWWAQK